MNILDAVDWVGYEDEVVELVRQSVAAFNEAQTGKKISQISIWTDVQGCVSAVSFETRAHAAQAIQSLKDFLEKEIERLGTKNRKPFESLNAVLRQQREEAENLEYNTNPANFEFREVRTFEHPGLLLLQESGFLAVKDERDEHVIAAWNHNKRAAEACVEISLLRVVERLLEEKVLQPLRMEECVWIGVSSPRDWYDHVRKIAL